jgi:hypothetical protein
MDPSRNCNKVIPGSAFMPLGDGVALRLEFGISFVESEFVGGYAASGSAGDSAVESAVFPSPNHVVPPNAGPSESDPKNQPAKNGSKKKPSLEQFQLSPKRKLLSNHP